ncbi:MAG: hypothetical protein GF315_06000 [candidate division Zixibacteria bacterium]|nr:hypothetical protein [candidate division Zixibacteria bacterium]
MVRDTVIVFEDEHYDGLYPISYTRPSYHILSGAKTNLQRIEHHFSDFNIIAVCREELSAIFGAESGLKIDQADSGRLILINGRIVLTASDGELITELKSANGPKAFVQGNTLVAAIIPPDSNKDFRYDLDKLHQSGGTERIADKIGDSVEVDVTLFHHIWEPMLINPKMIESDFREYYSENKGSTLPGDAHLYNSSDIYTAQAVTADAGSVIDAREGPIILEPGVEIKPMHFLEGPAYIGKNSRLVGGKTTGGCSLGEGCRIGGEVENSVIIGNSNKYHEGFLGHAYLGEWVNLGALTTNSDLKNNYTEINVKIEGKLLRTGSIKIGSFIGDHSKTGIGTTLNTGLVIGVSSNLFGGTLIIEKEIPGFAWGNDGLRREYALGKAVETAEVVLKRRGKQFDSNQQKLFKFIFEQSRKMRDGWIHGKRH